MHFALAQSTRRGEVPVGEMRKNYDLCGTCRQSDESRRIAVSCACYIALAMQKTRTSVNGRGAKRLITYGERTRRVFTDAQSKSASALFYSYPDHHRESSKAEIRFVYGIFGIEEVGENAISFPHAFCPAFYAKRSFPISRQIGYR